MSIATLCGLKPEPYVPRDPVPIRKRPAWSLGPETTGRQPAPTHCRDCGARFPFPKRNRTHCRECRE